MRIKIKANPRIHVTLIDMNRDRYRLNGGVGFSIYGPYLEINAKIAKENNVLDHRDVESSFTSDELERILQILNRETERLKFSNYVEIEISGKIPTHFGFGSSTATRLASIEVLYILNKYSFNRNELIVASGRGGTSGIGINAYFDGGYFVDVGRKIDDSELAPSHANESKVALPLLLNKVDMPPWEVGLCIPNIHHKTEEEEKKFFKNTCPISSADVNSTLYEVIYGLTSAVLENDFDVFCQSINAIQNCQWKLAERNQYGDELRCIEEEIYKAGAKAVGMSSLGPLLYFFGENIESIAKSLQSSLPKIRVLISKLSNSGRKIIHA